jgi:dynein heavy chain
MKDSLEKIHKSLDNFNTKYVERKTRPMAPEDYDSYLKAIFMNKIINVKDNGISIHKMLKEVLDAVKADKKNTEWKNYNDYVNCIVIDGIAAAIKTALLDLNDQINPINIKKKDLAPLFDIRLDIVSNNKGVVFEPEIEEIPHSS